uniref:Mannose-P-dolichol utilization defect 1 protein homolog n=1 Tax=Hanusia phi TaxID=3032 RepID=A0A6T7RA07_9CRYP|mmetsp:Transcript_28090/g.63535  ORF Transcript_28090/g.63535 Transcript_28090/m.63535 type:complete len:314 (+) Transcript_28090:335-1276(+)|eukprot:754418-Hanusia_phi.AAC.3
MVSALRHALGLIVLLGLSLPIDAFHPSSIPLKPAIRRGHCSSRLSLKMASSAKAPVALQHQVSLAACASQVKLQVLVSKFLGYGILVGSLFLQVPQLLRILLSRSVVGISATARYSEVPINSSSVIYHFLLGYPLACYGENIVVLIQNLIVVALIWAWRTPRVPVREMVFCLVSFALLCVCQLSLPKELLPWLIYVNIPFIFGSTVPQIVANARQGHTGQLSILTCFLKLVGCCVRIFTTITQIGLDPGLLLGYIAGATMNLTLVRSERVRRRRRLTRSIRCCKASTSARRQRNRTRKKGGRETMGRRQIDMN